jgi:hypothetical protein
MSTTRSRQEGTDALIDRAEAEQLPWPGKVTQTMPARRQAGAEWPGRHAVRAPRAGERDRPSAPPIVDEVVARGGGSALDTNVRAVMESQLGANLGGVKVHTDDGARAASAAIGARAFTYGSDVFLGTGESPTDLALMAHELTHVVQQGAAGKQGPQALAVGAADHPAEREADAVAARAVSQGVRPESRLVDQGMPTVQGQMTRDAFLAMLRPLVMAAADEELGRAGATVGCPYIERWFSHFATRPAAHVEQVAQRYSRRTHVADAREYIPPIIERLREGVRRWNHGQDVHADLAEAGITGTQIPPRPTGLAGAVSSAFSLFRKPVDEVVDRLGPGQPLDPTTAARFADATGQDVSGVRVHTDATAARLARNMDAAAFTVGNHVAFAPNTFQPGTPRGDALLAHELAHVAQQKPATPLPAADDDETAPRDDAELARQAVATESAAHETDANQAGAGTMSRLYSGAKSVMRKLTDRLEPVLTSEVQLQRCPSPQYEELPDTAPPAPESRLPQPVTMAFAGDRFVISFDGSTDRELVFVVHYTGPHRTSAENNTIRIPVPLIDPQFTGVQPQPYNAEVRSITDRRLTIDLMGDRSRLAVLEDEVVPGTDFTSRTHRFTAAMTSGYQVPHYMTVSWDASAAGAADVPTAPQIHAQTITLAGSRITLQAQRFGTTNQVQLRVSGGDTPGHNPDHLVSFERLDHVGLTVLRNTGRELHIDLDANGQPDVRLVHTIEDSGGLRIHHFRSFTPDGLFLGDHQAWTRDVGTPIPDEQNEATHRPDTSLEWPATRPPGQADIAGELPVAITRPGGITELRIDADGDRDKDILMRFHVEALRPNTDEVCELRIDMVQIASGQVASQRLRLDDVHAAPLRPVVRDVADGLRPLVISLTDYFPHGAPETLLTLPPPEDRGGRRIHTIQALGQTLTFDLPADTGPRPPLVQARPNGAADPSGSIGGVFYTDLQIGEYRDQFRFTAEQAGSVARFAVAGLADGRPFTGAGVQLTPGAAVTGLRVIAGDPRQIAFDLTGDGTADVLINDRLSQPTLAPLGNNIAEPVEVDRQHLLAIHGPRVSGISEQPFYISAGHWYQRYGFGPDVASREAAGATSAVSELARQRQEGNVAQLITKFEQAVATQRHDAIAQGVITQELYDAWNGLFQALTMLRPQVLPTPPQPATPANPQIQADAARHAANLARLLTEATQNHVVESRDPTARRNVRRRRNPYTGEEQQVEGVTDVDLGHVTQRSGAAVEIEADIRGGNWTRAYQHYTTLRDGLDHWIADEMVRRFGPQGRSAQWQLQMIDQLRTTSTSHPDARRVPAVFVADSSYSNHADYNTYRQLPVYLLLWREGTTWHLKDISNPEHPYEHTDGGGDAANPTAALFAELDYAREFPRGVIRYDVPNGPSGRVETTERKTWVDYVGYAAMILGAVALAATGIGAIAEVAGATAATVAVFNTVAGGAAIGAGVAGAVAGAGDIYERARHGDLDGTSLVIDVAQIVAGIFTAGAASSRIIVGMARTASQEGQAWTRLAARVALVADRAYVPLTLGAAGADVVTVAAMTSQAMDQISQIRQGGGSAADQERAITLLVANLLATGAITAMSVKGAFHDLRISRPNIVVDFVDNIPVARAAGVAIGGVEIPVSSRNPDAHASARWNAHGLEEASAAGHPGATAMTGDAETMRWYRAWMAQESKVRFRPDGSAEVRPFSLDGQEMPQPIRQQLQAYLDAPGNALSLYERSFINGDRMRQLQREIPGLDLHPASESWQRNRQRVIERLGGDAAAAEQVRRYEAALLGAAAPNAARYAAEHARITSLVPQTELDRIRALFAGHDVYITGSAASAGGRPLPGDVPDIDIFVVVPAGTSPDVMQAMEARAAGFRVRTDPDFNLQHGHPAGHTIGLDAKVMTPDQFFGFATTAVPGRTPLSYHSLGASAAAAAGTREASAQVAFRVMGSEAAGERLMTALGGDHARLETMAAALGDAEVRHIVGVLGEDRFARYAAVTDGTTLQAMVTGFPDARLRALEARITPQQIADAWRGGGAPALRVAEGLAPADLTRIMGSLGGERFGRYAAVTDGPTLNRLTTEVADATLRAVEARLTSEQIVRMFGADGARGVTLVEGALQLEAAGRLRGFADWVAFTAGKGPADLQRAAGELAEARRLADANPASVVNIGGDQRAPRRVSDGSAHQSFDITVETPAGGVTRSVEVTTVDAPVAQPGDVTTGVRHAIDKVESRARPRDPRDAAPIPGAHDATIRMRLDVGDRALRGGRVRQIFADGTVRIIDADGVFRTRPGNPSNLFDDIAANLPTIANNGNLDRVTLVDMNTGAVLATYERSGTTWTRR